MIIVKSVNKTYSDQTKALIDINLEIPSTGLFFVLGKSGSGKTTLLNLLSALDKPDTGNIVVDDLNISELNEKQSALFRSNNVGFVFQQYNLIERWTVEKNISFALELAGKPIDKNKIKKVCSELGLLDDSGEPLVNKKVANLSGGQKQRVAIARAIIKKPKILLCDEPTGALDKDNTKYLLNVLGRLSKDTCVIVVTHDRTIIDETSNIIEMANGRIITNSIQNSDHGSGNSNEIIKPKTRISSILSLAFNFLTASKFRLALSFLLLTVCLFAFSIPVIGSGQTDTDVIVDTLINRGEKYAVVSNYKVEDDNYSPLPFDKKQNQLINEYNAFENLNVFKSVFDDSKNYNSALLNKHPYQYLLGTSFEQVIEIPVDFDLSLIGVSRDSRLSNGVSCLMPKAINEIAITDLQADKLLTQGYIASEGEMPLKYNSIDEIVGSYLGEFLITGIYQTCDSRDLFKDYAESQVNDEIMLLAHGTYFSKMSFMLKGTMETIYKSVYSDELEKHSSEYMPSSSLIRAKSKSKMKTIYNELSNANKESNIVINSKYNHVIEKTSFLRNPLGKKILWVATGVMAAFTFISTSFMLFVEFDIKKKELGIITTLGAPKSYIAKLLLAESFILGSISLVFSGITTAVFSAIINTKMMHTVLTMNTLSFLFIILFAYLLMTIISSTIYLVHHKKKSIDLIKEL